eukprot:113042-Amphidinium_carterae.1
MKGKCVVYTSKNQPLSRMSDAAGRERRQVLVRGARKGGTCAAIQLTAKPASRRLASRSNLREVGVIA